MDVQSLLSQAQNDLTHAGIPSARLDSLILLEDATAKDRAWLLAHPEHVLTDTQAALLKHQLSRRLAREPLAYIRGFSEFYGRTFKVTPDTLIPRPETEHLIETAMRLSPMHILDVGTGSGAIAVSLALALPKAEVRACDISLAALNVARHNAAAFGAHVVFYQDNLLAKAETYDLITANLPYVDPSWERSPETAYEPALALFADNHGLALITTLLNQAPGHLTPRGYLLLEADPRQFNAIINAAEPYFTPVLREGFTLLLQRI